MPSARVIAGRGPQGEGAVRPVADLGPEPVADPFQYCLQPPAVGGARVAQPHLAGLHGHHVQGGESAGAGRYRGKVQQPQIAAELLASADALAGVNVAWLLLFEETPADRASLAEGRPERSQAGLRTWPSRNQPHKF
jgi:hypothetical protein